jgi:hypothetical protein
VRYKGQEEIPEDKTWARHEGIEKMQDDAQIRGCEARLGLVRARMALGPWLQVYHNYRTHMLAVWGNSRLRRDY